MVKWREAYERLKGTTAFRNFFGGNGVPAMSDFRYIVFSHQQLSTTPLTPSAAAAGGAPGVAVGPLQMNFPSGAIILGVTSSAFQAQQAAAAPNVPYSPSMNAGRRDLYTLSFQYTSDEQLTANGGVIADALLGGGDETVMPAKEVMIPPSQSILITAASLVALGGQNLFVHVAFHCMVPRMVG